MKYFLIKYHFQEGSNQEEWHREISRFISELDNDPELKGKITYRCLKGKDSEYYHFAGAVDEKTVKLMQQRDFFKRYSERMRAVAGGAVDVSHLENIAETQSGVG